MCASRRRVRGESDTEHELANVDELLKRLKDAPTGTASV